MEMDMSESKTEFNVDLITDFINTCQNICNLSDFRHHIYPKIKSALPHNMFAFGTASLSDLRAHALTNISFPSEYFEKTKSMICPALLAWEKSRSPVHIHSKTPLLRSKYRSWFKCFTQHKIETLTMHGVLDFRSSSIYFFAFGGIDSWSRREELMLQLLVPQMYCLLINKNDFFNIKTKIKTILTQREEEVLQLICKGKSNSDAADILCISPWTVKIHVRNLLSKLNVSNRSHAIVKAINLGLVTH